MISICFCLVSEDNSTPGPLWAKHSIEGYWIWMLVIQMDSMHFITQISMGEFMIGFLIRHTFSLPSHHFLSSKSRLAASPDFHLSLQEFFLLLSHCSRVSYFSWWDGVRGNLPLFNGLQSNSSSCLCLSCFFFFSCIFIL